MCLWNEHSKSTVRTTRLFGLEHTHMNTNGEPIREYFFGSPDVNITRRRRRCGVEVGVMRGKFSSEC